MNSNSGAKRDWLRLDTMRRVDMQRATVSRDTVTRDGAAQDEARQGIYMQTISAWLDWIGQHLARQDTTRRGNYGKRI